MHRSPLRRRRLRLAALLLGLLLLPLALLRAAQPVSDAEAVARAWELAQASGRYDYRAHVEQTVYPRASLANAGRSARMERFALQGTVDQGAETLELMLWQNDFGSPEEALGLRVDHGATFARQGAGAWERQDGGGADMIAPGGDPLGFLAGLRDVTRAGAEQRDFAGQDLTLAYVRYTFAMDGPAFAAALKDKLEAQLRASGDLPAGVSLDPAAYRDMQGSGEVWLDGEGLPRRMALRIDLPPQRSSGRIIAKIESEYFNFDHAQLALASTSFAANPGGWLRYRLDRAAPALGALAQGALVCL
ncbi:MAG TPA: hypothetical protein VGE07_17660, partial [Herpetosiphonaceae bacterium]